MTDSEKNFYATLGRRIRVVRKQAKVTECRLAEQIGVHRNTLMRWEKGNAVSVWELLSIAQSLGVSIETLLPFSWPIGRAA